MRSATLAAFLAAFTAMPIEAATFTVNILTDGADATAGDGVCETAAGNGQCSLRAAIQEGNANADSDTINFSVTGTITVTSNLPAITAELAINAPVPAGSVIVSGGGSFSLLRYTGASTTDNFITNVTLQDATTTDQNGGAALYFNPTVFSTLDLTDVTVKNSIASVGPGGGIVTGAGDTFTMTRGAVTGSSSSNGDGGGISVRGPATLTNVTVSGNDAINGGGIGLAGGTLTLTGSTISGNTATQDGGGLYIGLAPTVPLPTSSSATLSNCTIAGNLAANGGGIGANSANTLASSMVHCTVAGNFASAGSGGGGIGVLDPTPPTPPAAANGNKFFPGTVAKPFTNNVVTDNFISASTTPPPGAQRSDCRQPFSHSDLEDSGYNIESAAACGFAQMSDRQNVGGCTTGLADRLGLTQTRGLSGGCDEAFDRANTSWDTTTRVNWDPATDQRGAPLADGNESGGAQRDIGAYEFGAYGAVRFQSGSIGVREDAGTVTAQLERFGNLSTLGATTNVDFSANSGCTTCSATEEDDYTTQTGTRSWASGDGSAKEIVVAIVDDDLLDDDLLPGDEVDETFQITLSGLTKGADFAAPSGATVTITNIEKGAIQLSSGAEVFVCETANAPLPDCADPTIDVGSVTFTVRRVSANPDPDPAGDPNVSVTFQTQNGTAVGGAACGPGVDFVNVDTTVSWPADDTTNKTVTVTVCDDAEFEADQSFTVVLANPTNGARLGTPTSATVTILSDDTADPGNLQFQFSNFNVSETAGTATVTVQRVDGDDTQVTVNYQTSGGSAQAGQDYSSRSGTLTWGPDDTADKTFTVPIINDTLREADQSFTVTLSSPSDGNANAPNPGLGTPSTATVTIQSEDLMKFRFTQASWTAIEGSPVSILVEPIQAVVDGPYAIDFQTANGTADGSDYTPTSGSLTFNNGETAAKSFPVATTADALVEGNQTFTVQLSTATANGEILAPNSTTVTISEDDVGFQLDAASYTVGEAGASIDVKVMRIGSSTGAVSVDYATADDTAAAGSDYTSASGTLNWADGDTADKTVTLTIAEDSLDETNETFTFALSGESAGTQLLSPNSASVTITDNDAAPTLTINSPSVTEGNTGTTALAFSVVLSSASGQSVMVDFASANGTATAGSDYTPVGGTLTFAAGETSKPVPVTVAADTLDEDNETLTVTLSNAVNAGITTAVGTGTITDDDNPPTVSIGDASVTEGDTTDVTLSFPVTLSAASGRTVTVNYTTANGTATAPGDYTAVSSATISFAAGQTSNVAVVTVKSDSVDESVETMTVALSAPVNVTILDGNATGAINDAADDLPSPRTGDDTPTVVVTVTGGTVTATSNDGGGSFSASGLLGLLGLLTLRRRRVGAALLGACLALAPGAASAAGLSYEYADVRYISVNIDPDIGADGFSLAGSRLMKPNVFLTGSYARAGTDDFAVQGVSGSVKSSTFSAGVGMRRALKSKFDATGAFSLVHAKAEGEGGFTGDASDTGFALEAGLRGWLAPKVESGVAVSYLSIFDGGSTALNAQGLYHFNPKFALALGAGLSDDSTQFNLGARFGF